MEILPSGIGLMVRETRTMAKEKDMFRTLVGAALCNMNALILPSLY